MAVSINVKLAAITEAQRGKVEARAAEIVAKEMSLRELNKPMGKTEAKRPSQKATGWIRGTNT